jgi:hypothetical protein
VKKHFGKEYKTRKMNIKIITPPDVIFDQALSITVINPDESLKKNLEKFLSEVEYSVNVYLYNNDNDIKWLLSQAKMSDYVILNIDSEDDETSQFVSYILSLPNTYYKVQHMVHQWDLLNKNRFYDFPNLIEDIDERTT